MFKEEVDSEIKSKKYRYHLYFVMNTKEQIQAAHTSTLQ